MNILEIEDMIKGLPDQALQEEAQAPSGQVPQFLVVSEIQRRTDMRKRFQAQDQQPQGTVSDQILQEGIASIAPQQQMPQQMMPQQQMPQEAMMYSGGIVEMADLGRVPYGSISPNVDMGRLYEMYGDQSQGRPSLDFRGAWNQYETEEEEDLYQPQYTPMQSRIGEIISENNPDYVLLNQSMNQAERIPPNVYSPEKQEDEGSILDSLSSYYRPSPQIVREQETISPEGSYAERLETEKRQRESVEPSEIYFSPTTGFPWLERSTDQERINQLTEIIQQIESTQDTTHPDVQRRIQSLQKEISSLSSVARAENLVKEIEGKSSTDEVIEEIEGGGTDVDSGGINTGPIIDDSKNKQGVTLGRNAASAANPTGKASEQELQQITDTNSLLAQVHRLRMSGQEVKQPDYEKFRQAAQDRADKIREETRQDAYSQALIQFGAGVAEGDMARGLRDAGTAVAEAKTTGRTLATEEQRIQEAYALKIAEADSDKEKVRLQRESDALTLASTILGEIGKTDRSVQGLMTAILRDPLSATMLLEQAQEEAERIAKLQNREPTRKDVFDAYMRSLQNIPQTIIGGSGSQTNTNQPQGFSVAQ